MIEVVKKTDGSKICRLLAVEEFRQFVNPHFGKGSIILSSSKAFSDGKEGVIHCVHKEDSDKIIKSESRKTNNDYLISCWSCYETEVDLKELVRKAREDKDRKSRTDLIICSTVGNVKATLKKYFKLFIEKNIIDEGKGVDHGVVNYYTTDSDCATRNGEEARSNYFCIFHKQQRYIYEKEYRFCVMLTDCCPLRNLSFYVDFKEYATAWASINDCGNITWNSI